MALNKLEADGIITVAYDEPYEKRTDIMTQAKNTICLWYDKDAEEAANFYAATLPDSGVTAVHRS